MLKAREPERLDGRLEEAERILTLWIEHQHRCDRCEKQCLHKVCPVRETKRFLGICNGKPEIEWA